MARFPRREAEVVQLAQLMFSGLTDNADIYPAPLVPAADLMAKISAYNTAKSAAIAAQAEYAGAISDKDEAYASLIDDMKTDIIYAENTVNGNDSKLNLIGWGGRKAPSAMVAPGQSRLLEAPKQGAGWVFLDWKKPAEGGDINAYRIMRRELPEGDWQGVAVAIISEATLVEQPTCKQLEYHIIAINKVGEGEPSNTVMVVL